MSSMYRFELLKEGQLLNEMQHASVGGVLLAAYQDAPALAHATYVMNTAPHNIYIPPWWATIHQGNLTLGFGFSTDDTGREHGEYRIERCTRIGPVLFAVRAVFLDNDGTPLKFDYNILDVDLELSQALEERDRYIKELGSSFHVDVLPTNLVLTE